MSHVTPTADEITNRVNSEFIEEARDILNELDVLIGNVRGHAVPDGDAIAELKRACLTLRVGGRSANLPVVDLLVHRLENYIQDLSALEERNLDDLQTYLDRVRAAIDGELQPTAAELPKVVRQLPQATTFDIGDIKLMDIEIMVVSPQRTTAHFLERELRACGYRTLNVARSFDAIEQAVRAKPDMIICSAIIDELSGIDLACAFGAMPATAQIPFALLTSFGWGHPSLEGLPPRAAIIRKGQQFGDDLAVALSRFAIT